MKATGKVVPPSPRARPFKGINWPLLRRQKATLVKLAGSLGKTEAGHLEGIIALLDNLQDYAVDKAGISEKTVFGKLN